MSFENLPQIPGYSWRAMQLDDAAAVHQFELVCSELDGATRLRRRADWEQKLTDEAQSAANSVIAIGEDGDIAAAGWVDFSTEAHEVRAFLDGRVHPDHRGQGVGTSLLTWLEERGREYMASIAGERRQVLRIMFYDRTADAIDLFERHGFRYLFSEEEMRCDLHEPLPEYTLPAGMTFHTWTPENASDYFMVYDAAFRTRPGPNWGELAWRYHFAEEEDEEFHPDLSLLVKNEDEPVAYAVCHMDAVDEAWIAQMGVRPPWRRCGIASALLVALLRRLWAEGHTYAMLSVNVNNPEARRLYERLGFRLTRRFTIYHRVIQQ